MLINLTKLISFLSFSEAEELSTRLMHTIIDIRNDENGRVVLEEAKRDKISNPFDLQCIYFEELLSKYRTHFFIRKHLNGTKSNE